MRLNGLSLFSNVGIAEAYLKDVGIDVVLANEIDEKRARFYQEIYSIYSILKHPFEVNFAVETH